MIWTERPFKSGACPLVWFGGKIAVLRKVKKVSKIEDARERVRVLAFQRPLSSMQRPSIHRFGPFIFALTA